MRRTTAFAFLVCCLIAGPFALASSRGPPAKAAPKPYLAAKAGCVLLRVEGKLAGSGWIASAKGRVVTCRHVVVGSVDVDVELADGTLLAAVVLRSDASVDLALLQIAGGKDFHVLLLAKLPPDPGDDCWTWGHSRKLPWSLSRGIVAAVGRTIETELATLADILQLDLTVGPGSSGGPLLDSSGHVTGTIVAYHPGTRGFAFAVSAATVRAFLDAKEVPRERCPPVGR